MSSYQYRKSHCVEIRRSHDRLIFTMGFPILVRWHLYIELGPRSVPDGWDRWECTVGEGGGHAGLMTIRKLKMSLLWMLNCILSVWLFLILFDQIILQLWEKEERIKKKYRIQISFSQFWIWFGSKPLPETILSSSGLLWTRFTEILIEIQTFSFKENYSKMLETTLYWSQYVKGLRGNISQVCWGLKCN